MIIHQTLFIYSSKAYPVQKNNKSSNKIKKTLLSEILAVQTDTITINKKTLLSLQQGTKEHVIVHTLFTFI